MTKEETYRYIDNLKWLKGYDNTTIGGKTVGEILDEIEAMLKEQEPVPPEKQNGYQAEWPSSASWWYVCGACGRKIDYHDRFCRWCGRSIKWE